MSLLDILIQCINNIQKEEQQQKQQMLAKPAQIQPYFQTLDKKNILQQHPSPKNQHNPVQNNLVQSLRDNTVHLFGNRNLSSFSLHKKQEDIDMGNQQKNMEEQAINLDGYLYVPEVEFQDQNESQSSQESQFKIDQYRKINKRQKQNKNQRDYQISQFTSQAEQVNAKIYVMKAIKNYLTKQQNTNMEIEDQFDESNLTKEKMDEFYHNLLKQYSLTVEKKKMFQSIRKKLPKQLVNQSVRLILRQLNRVKLRYTYGAKEIQKVMWNILMSRFGFGWQPSKQFKENKYIMVNNVLHGQYLYDLHNKFMKSEIAQQRHLYIPIDKHDQVFWQYLHNVLRMRNFAKYDPFLVESIRNKYFNENRQVNE